MSDPKKASLDGGAQEEPEEALDTSLQLKGGMALPSVGWAQGAQDYLSEVRSEFKKITWPTRRQVATETAVVIGVVVFLTVLITFFDWVFAFVANRLLV